MTRCCVPGCSEIGTHKFPRDDNTKRIWLKAIRRQNFKPTNSSRLCGKHFVERDYQNISKYTGTLHQRKYLKALAVPSVFKWNVKPPSAQAEAREARSQARNTKKKLFQESQPSTSTQSPLQDMVLEINSEEFVLAADEEHDLSECANIIEKSHRSWGTQTPNIMKMFSTEFLLIDNEAVHFYTGLESFAKFKLVLSTLLPMGNHLNYRWSQVIGLSVEDQFLMLLIKLRRNKPDFELSKMFNVSKTEVSNIIVTWINFVNDLWSVIDIWPSRELVNFYMPDSFKRKNSVTRIIIDGTEIPIQKPSEPTAQRATFSSYKHKNTLKFLVGSSPGGLLTYCSRAYAGSTSDRQIVERSNLLQLCEKGDSIMADRGFNVQDLFATKGIGINIPTFLKGKSQIPGLLLKKDEKLASQRVHIERLIGLTKTYKILMTELNQFYVPIASKIYFICLMLCNFREGIVNKNIK